MEQIPKLVVAVLFAFASVALPRAAPADSHDDLRIEDLSWLSGVWKSDTLRDGLPVDELYFSVPRNGVIAFARTTAPSPQRSDLTANFFGILFVEKGRYVMRGWSTIHPGDPKPLESGDAVSEPTPRDARGILFRAPGEEPQMLVSLESPEEGRLRRRSGILDATPPSVMEDEEYSRVK